MADAVNEWELYRAHRTQLTRALLESAPRSNARLCLLGAGKCNDVDLPALAEKFSEIHLVDIEPSALASAVARQEPALRRQLRPHTVDLSLLTAKRAGKWLRKAPTPADVRASAALSLSEVLGRLRGPFDVVASVCVLTQLAFAVRAQFGERHPALALVRSATMLHHLSTLLGLTAPGGVALFTSDLTSSNQYPLATLPEGADLHAVGREIVKAGAGYLAASPELILRMLREDPALEASVERTETLAPWLWTGPLARTYFVYALRIQRR